MSRSPEPAEDGGKRRRLALWSGSLSFGLVAIPVRVVPAVRSQHLAFHMLHDQDHARLQRRMVCSLDGQPVAAEDMIRGVEVAPERYVTVREEELDALAPQASQIMEILHFVPRRQMDPLYFEKPYFLLPDGVEKPYTLLARVLAEEQQAGVASFAMRGQEYRAALLSTGRLLGLALLHYPEEVLLPPAWEGLAESDALSRAAADLETFIRARTGDFEPARYTNPYAERMLAAIRKKQEQHEVVAAPEAGEEELLEPEDLIAALERTMAKARESQSPWLP